jgi:molybdopterin-guanine dinucleotide biosynthesis protein A
VGEAADSSESAGLLHFEAGRSFLEWQINRVSEIFSEVLIIVSTNPSYVNYLKLLDKIQFKLPVRVLPPTRTRPNSESDDLSQGLVASLRSCNSGWSLIHQMDQPILQTANLEILMKHIFFARSVGQVSPVAYHDPFSGSAIPTPSLWPKALKTIIESQLHKKSHPIQWFLENLNTVFYDGRSYLRENPIRFATEDDAKRFIAMRS